MDSWTAELDVACAEAVSNLALNRISGIELPSALANSGQPRDKSGPLHTKNGSAYLRVDLASYLIGFADYYLQPIYRALPRAVDNCLPILVNATGNRWPID